MAYRCGYIGLIISELICIFHPVKRVSLSFSGLKKLFFAFRNKIGRIMMNRDSGEDLALILNYGGMSQ